MPYVDVLPLKRYGNYVKDKVWFFLLQMSYLIDMFVQFPYLYFVVSHSFEIENSQHIVGSFHFQHLNSPSARTFVL